MEDIIFEGRSLDEIEQILARCESAVGRLRSIQMRALRHVDRLQGPLADGCRSMGEWVTGRLDVSPDTAKSLVSTAQRLGELPAVEEGAAGGDLTYDRAVAVARLAEGGDGTTALEESAGLDVAGIHRQVAQRRRLSRHQEAFDDTYAWVRRNGDEILHLRLVPELDPAANESAGYFHVEDADSWHAAWTGGDVHLTAIEDHPSGMREFSDPNGNLIRVGHNL